MQRKHAGTRLSICTSQSARRKAFLMPELMGSRASSCEDFAQPPVCRTERKQSSGDLHSRLKMRKLLGVGGTDDGGDVYRSKLSQILGLGERLQRRLPRGVREWQLVCALGFTCLALLALAKPSMLMSNDATISSNSSVQSLIICRLYGGCMLVISCGLWLAWSSADFYLVRCSLVATAALLAVHLAVLFGDQQVGGVGQASLLAAAIVSTGLSVRLR